MSDVTPVPESDADQPFLSGPAYDKVKFFALIVLPAAAAFYATVAELLNLPYGLQVVAIVAAFDTFVGFVLSYSSKKFYNSTAGIDGVLRANGYGEDGTSNLHMAINKMPDELLSKKIVRLKVEG